MIIAPSRFDKPLVLTRLTVTSISGVAHSVAAMIENHTKRAYRGQNIGNRAASSGLLPYLPILNAPAKRRSELARCTISAK